MKRLSKYFSSLLLICLFATGCATMMPSTEGLVFTGNGYRQSKFTASNTDYFWKYLSYGVTMSYTRIIHPESFRRAAVRKYRKNQQKNGKSDVENQLDPLYFWSYPVPSAYISYKNRVALGSSLPLPFFWQIDGTFRLFHQYYLTVSKNLFKPNTQVILERRMLYHNHGGITLGVFYRYDKFKFKSSPIPLLGRAFNISWFGMRSLFQLPEAKLSTDTHFSLRGVISAGYVPEFNVPLFVVGLSFNFRFNVHHHHRSRFPGPVFQ